MEDELVTDLWDGLTNLSNKEKYDYIVDIAELIKEDGAKRFGDNMVHVLNNICTQYNICPICGSELEIKPDFIFHEEMDDNNIENCNKLYCPSCGYIVN